MSKPKSYWNYRIIKSVEGYYLSEVHYEKGTPKGWTKPLTGYYDDPKDIIEELLLMQKAVHSPLLKEETSISDTGINPLTKKEKYDFCKEWDEFNKLEGK